MIVLSINLLILSVLILIVGLIKPRWLLFWMDNPGRLPIIAIASVLFMIAAVMFGEASVKKKTPTDVPEQSTPATTVSPELTDGSSKADEKK